MNGRIVGLPVHAVVCTQNGQCAEIPSRRSFAFAKAALISLALLKSFVRLQHVIRGLRAGGPRFLRPFQEGFETLRPVLGAFDTRVKTILAHMLCSVVDCCARSLSVAPRRSNRKTVLPHFALIGFRSPIRNAQSARTDVRGYGAVGSRRRESALIGFRSPIRNAQSARTDVRGYGAVGSRRRESALIGFRNPVRNAQSARTDVRGYGAVGSRRRESALIGFRKPIRNTQSARTDVRGYGAVGSRRRESALEGFCNPIRNTQSARTDVRGYGAVGSGRVPGIAPRHPPTPPDVRFSASGG